MNSTARARFQYSGGRRPTKEAKTAPATPAKNDEMANAISLVAELRHTHDLGGDVTVADRLEGPSGTRADEVLGDDDEDRQQGQREQVALLLAGDVEPQPLAVVGERDDRILLLPPLNSSGGKLRPTSDCPEISGSTRDRWMPMNTSPTVTMARYRPRTRTAAGATMMPTSAAPIPAPGSQTHIGSPWPQARALASPPRNTAV